MSNFKNIVKNCLNNENGGANVQTLFIIGAGLAILMALFGFKERIYLWIKSADEMKSRPYAQAEM